MESLSSLEIVGRIECFLSLRVFRLLSPADSSFPPQNWKLSKQRRPHVPYLMQCMPYPTDFMSVYFRHVVPRLTVPPALGQCTPLPPGLK